MTEEALMTQGTLTDERVLRAIELVWREARLLDQAEYEAWNELYTDDGHYIIPIDPQTTDFDNSLNMIYDDRRMRRLRVHRMTEGHAIAALDAARTIRTVSRFSVDEASDEQVTLHAAQVLVAYKRGNHDLWAGEVEYSIRLGATAAEDRILRKIIRLVDSEDVVPAAGFLL